MSPELLKKIVQALVFVSDKPLTIEQVKEVTGSEAADIRQCFAELGESYAAAQSGFLLKEIAGGWQFVTDSEMAPYIRTYVQHRDQKKLSGAGLETLSIIAYKQPITRAEIEYIRGVNVDGSMKTLLEKGLVKISGRKEVPGRPLLYSTTKFFLDHFGLAGLRELPKLAEFTENDIELPASLRHSVGELMPGEILPEETLPEGDASTDQTETADETRSA
jgi:segregation and condensation protein B